MSPAIRPSHRRGSADPAVAAGVAAGVAPGSGPQAGLGVGRGIVLALLLAALSGCGAATEAGDPRDARADAGRPSEAASNTPVPARQVADDARDEVDCDGAPEHTGAGDYVDGGLETVQADPAAAVENLLAKNYVGAPGAEYVVAARNDSRALVSYEVGGEAKVTFVVEDGIADWDGNVGWGVTSYAVCDLAEMPPEIAEAAGVGVWTDADGERVATSRMRSYPGPEQCDWQDITFLQVGEWRAEHQYLRDVDGDLARSTWTSYALEVPLPADATDSGWRREGRALWLVPDRRAAYLVDLDDRAGATRGRALAGCAGADRLHVTIRRSRGRYRVGA